MRVQEREGKKMGGCKRAGLINSDNVLWDHRDKVVLSIRQAIRLRCFGGAAVRVRFCFLPMASSAPHCAAGRTKGPGAPVFTRHAISLLIPAPNHLPTSYRCAIDGWFRHAHLFTFKCEPCREPLL